MSGDLFSRLQAEVEAREKAAGLSMADALALPDAPRKLFNWLVRRGEVGRHVTATGEDVSGFHYLAFDNGAKIFFRPGLEVVVARTKV
jgi:hypothetical protein